MTHKQTKAALERVYWFEQYKKTHNVDEADLVDVAHWAFTTGLWKYVPVDPEQILRRELSRALRGEYIVDPQDREVRKNHPVPMLDGRVIWVDLTKARPEQMHLSFAWRRNGVLADCKQMMLDFDSYNDNNLFDATLPQPDCNFNPDIEELRMPTKYPEDAPVPV
jgi:hypothetical protein